MKRNTQLYYYINMFALYINIMLTKYLLTIINLNQTIITGVFVLFVLFLNYYILIYLLIDFLFKI